MIKKRERIFLIILNGFSFLVFTLLFIASLNNSIPSSFDYSLYQNVGLWQRPFLNNIMVSISSFFHPGVLLFLTILFFPLFLIKKDSLHGIIFLLSTFFGIVSALILKEIISSVRPIGIIPETSFGFPSAHATVAATFFISALLTLRDYIKNNAIENIITALGIIVLILVGLSRVYLQVHWFTDFLAGFTLGLFWVTFFIIIYYFDFKDFKTKNDKTSSR